MIIGLGSDLCNIERIQNSLDRFGERFENRVFTESGTRQGTAASHTQKQVPTRNALPQRRPIPKRSEPALRRAYS